MWNPLIIDLDHIPAEAKDLETRKQLADVQTVLPEHELVFRYDWVPARPGDDVFGCIGQPLNDRMLNALVELLGLDAAGKEDAEERTRVINYWWPRYGDKKMIPLGYFKMPSSFDEVSMITLERPDPDSYSGPMTNYYGYRDMRITGKDFNRFNALRYITTFYVFGTMNNDWVNPLNQCRVLAHQDMSPDVQQAHPDIYKKASADERVARLKEVAAVILDQTDYRLWEDSTEYESRWIKPPQHTLAAPKLVVEADCLYEGRFKTRFDDQDGKLWDYATCGRMTYEQWNKDKRFNTNNSVCQLFGRPASQQEPHRPLSPDRHPYPSAMIPLLNFNDSDHDMTHQLYVDGLRMDYCQDRKATTYIESSCT